MKTIFTTLALVLSFTIYHPIVNAKDISSVNLNTGWIIFLHKRLTLPEA